LTRSINNHGLDASPTLAKQRRLFVLFCLFTYVVSAQSPFAGIHQSIASGTGRSVLRILDSCAAKNYMRDSVLYYRGMYHIKNGENKEARKSIDALSSDFPAFSETGYLNALLAFSENNYARSIDHFTEVLNRQPGHRKALYNRAIVFGLLEDYLPAIEDLTTLIALDPSNGEAYYSRAYWYEYTGNYPLAIKDYEQAIRLNNNNYDAYLGLAFIHHAQRNPVLACEVITKAIAAGSQAAEELKYNYCR
jgi:tetratricopeptide (TPR) repeat protein